MLRGIPERIKRAVLQLESAEDPFCSANFKLWCLEASPDSTGRPQSSWRSCTRRRPGPGPAHLAIEEITQRRIQEARSRAARRRMVVVFAAAGPAPHGQATK